MKRILTILASAAVLFAAMSCEPEQIPTLSFGKSHYVLLADSPLAVELTTSVAPVADLAVELSFAGTATAEEYSCPSEVVIPAGQLAASFEIVPMKNFKEGSSLVVSFKLPAGYQIGENATTTVAIEQREELIYSFVTEASDVVGFYNVQVELAGLESGDEWVATKEMHIPYTITSLDGSPMTAIAADSKYMTVPVGENVATLTVRPGENYNASKFSITVSDGGYTAGDVEFMELTVYGVLTPASLVGTWEFEEVLDLEELELWFMEYEDDPELLPTHNQGFKFTVTEVKDGANVSYKFTPSGTGDWMTYFKECTITNCAPMNMCAKGFVTGDYTSSEGQMFVQEAEGRPNSELTYFELSSVNRSFDSSSETLGKGCIAISHDSEGKLIVQLKDYDEPPFGFMWWDGFEPDMFSFASRFVKK